MTEDELQELSNSNGQRIQALAARGFSLDLQPLILRHLMEFMLPEAEDRARLNESFQAFLAGVLDEVEQQANRMALTQNLHVPGPSPVVR